MLAYIRSSNVVKTKIVVKILNVLTHFAQSSKMKTAIKRFDAPGWLADHF